MNDKKPRIRECASISYNNLSKKDREQWDREDREESTINIHIPQEYSSWYGKDVFLQEYFIRSLMIYDVDTHKKMLEKSSYPLRIDEVGLLRIPPEVPLEHRPIESDMRFAPGDRAGSLLAYNRIDGRHLTLNLRKYPKSLQPSILFMRRMVSLLWNIREVINDAVLPLFGRRN